jgi:hypothetical protein
MLGLLCGVANAETAQREVVIHFALQSGADAVDCSHDVKGLGVNKIGAKLRDARFYLSAPALIDEAGKAVPIELTESEWQYANVALLDFEDKTGTCTGSASMNDSIKGVVPPGKYKGFTFVVGVPSVLKDAAGKELVLNHSNFATAAAPLDIQGMAWNWQAGRKFIRLELQPDGGVTRQPPKPRGAEGGEEKAKTAEGGGERAGGRGGAGEGGGEGGRASEFWKTETLASNPDGTITVKTWMLHFGSTGCKGDAMTGEIVSCAAPNRAPVTFAAFDPQKQRVVFDVAALLAGVDLNRDAGGATGCMSSASDPECAEIYAKLGLNLKESDVDANDQGQPAKGAVQQVFRLAPLQRVRESKN